MTAKRKPQKAKRVAAKKNASSKARVRVSISFPPDMHGTLEQIAKDKKVSLAWVVRDAVDMYLNEKWPLFKKPGCVLCRRRNPSGKLLAFPGGRYSSNSVIGLLQPRHLLAVGVPLVGVRRVPPFHAPCLL